MFDIVPPVYIAPFTFYACMSFWAPQEPKLWPMGILTFGPVRNFSIPDFTRVRFANNNQIMYPFCEK